MPLDGSARGWYSEGMTRRTFLTALLATAAIATIDIGVILDTDEEPPPSAGRRYQINCTAWCQNKG